MKKFSTVFIFVLVAVFAISFALAAPNGASNITEESSSTYIDNSDPANHSAIAGNVTEISVYGESVTQSWQGYFGNVTGAIRLSDSSNNSMYNWSLASPQGEIFASTDDSITWTGIQCFNWTNNGTDLETSYNINDSEDGINETFSDSGTHDEFTVGLTSFIADQCMSTQIFDNTGSGTASTFDEVLLADADGNPIFTAILEQDTMGFNNKPHDFEMLVIEDGHSGDTDTTPYYFYVELE